MHEVVKSQQSVQQHALQQTTDHLQTLSHTVASLTQNLPSSSAGSPSPGLRLPHLVLPLYTGREHLDRFLSQLESILRRTTEVLAYLFNPIAYGILRLSQLRGDFYPTPQKTMLKLFDWFEIWYT